MERIGLAIFGNVSKLAGRMAEAAFELHKELIAEQKKVLGAIEKTLAKRTVRIEQKKKEREELQHTCNEEWKLIQDMQCEAEAKHHEIKQKKDDQWLLRVLAILIMSTQ